MQKQKLFINFLKVQAFAEGIKIIAQTKNSNNIWDFFCFFFNCKNLPISSERNLRSMTAGEQSFKVNDKKCDINKKKIVMIIKNSKTNY